MFSMIEATLELYVRWLSMASKLLDASKTLSLSSMVSSSAFAFPSIGSVALDFGLRSFVFPRYFRTHTDVSELGGGSSGAIDTV